MSKHPTSSNIHFEPPSKKQKLVDPAPSSQAGNLRRNLHGVSYQITLIALCIVRAARKNYKNYSIDTESSSAGKFDDIVFRYQKNNKTFIKYVQAKHTQDENCRIDKIKGDEILSFSKRAKFGILKYFDSYLKIQGMMKDENAMEDFIICTNIDFKCENTDKVGLKRLTTSYGELYIEQIYLHDELLTIGEHCTAYRFVTKSYKNHHKTTLHTMYEFIDEMIFNGKFEYYDKANFETFLEKLYFIVNHPTNKELRKAIKSEIKSIDENFNLYDPSIVLDFLQTKVIEWLESKKAYEYQKHELDKFINEVRSTICSFEVCGNTFEFTRELNEKEIDFKYDLGIFTELREFFEKGEFVNLITNEYSLVIGSLIVIQAIKIFQSPFENGRVIFIKSSTFKYIKNEVLNALKNPGVKILTIQHDFDVDLSEIRKVYGKKTILISKTKIDDRFVSLKDVKLFSSLTEYSQNKLLNKIITFQGVLMKLKELLNYSESSEFSLSVKARNELLNKALDSESFETLLDENFEIGELPPATEIFFIDRKYSQEKKNFNEEIFLSKATHQIVALFDTPGVGKTTIMNHLFEKLKSKNPKLWIMKIKVSNFIVNSPSKDSIIDELTKDLKPFEKNIFKHFYNNKKVILMFDGFDEINDNGKEKFIEVFTQLSQNTHQIWLASRKLLKKWQDKLQIPKKSIYSLTKFSPNDSINCITNYFTFKLEKKYQATKKEEIKNFAKKIFNHLSKIIKDGTFFGTALRTRMLAEIYENEFIENYEGNREPELPEKMNRLEFFDLYVQRKAELFLENEEGETKF